MVKFGQAGTKCGAELMMKAFLSAMAMIIATSTIANCEPKANDLLEFIDSDHEDLHQAATTYMNGLSRGLFWANVRLAASERAQLYCEPDNLSLTSDQIVSIFRNYMAKNSSDGEEPAGMILMFALKDVFPC